MWLKKKRNLYFCRPILQLCLFYQNFIEELLIGHKCPEIGLEYGGIFFISKGIKFKFEFIHRIRFMNLELVLS